MLRERLPTCKGCVIHAPLYANAGLYHALYSGNQEAPDKIIRRSCVRVCSVEGESITSLSMPSHPPLDNTTTQQASRSCGGLRESWTPTLTSTSWSRYVGRLSML